MNLYLALILLSFASFFVAFEIFNFTKKHKFIDSFWGFAYVLQACYIGEITNWENPLIIGLIIAWGIRLGMFLLLRNGSYKHDDARYIRLAKGKSKTGIFFKIYMVQFVLQLVVALPIIYPAHDISYLIDWRIFFLVITGIGIIIESIADQQLLLFKLRKSNEGKRLNEGLRRYSQFPNYFGEILVWSGLGFYVASFGYYFALISPILIITLLFGVSGVPMQKNKSKKSFIIPDIKLILKDLLGK